MRSFLKASPILALVLLGLTRLFTTSAVSVAARTFCLVSVVVFVGAALFGLVSKLLRA
jgi:hypothetical protein